MDLQGPNLSTPPGAFWGGVWWGPLSPSSIFSCTKSQRFSIESQIFLLEKGLEIVPLGSRKGGSLLLFKKYWGLLPNVNHSLCGQTTFGHIFVLACFFKRRAGFPYDFGVRHMTGKCTAWPSWAWALELLWLWLPFAHLWSGGIGSYHLRLFSWPRNTSVGHTHICHRIAARKVTTDRHMLASSLQSTSSLRISPPRGCDQVF